MAWIQRLLFMIGKHIPLQCVGGEIQRGKKVGNSLHDFAQTMNLSQYFNMKYPVTLNTIEKTLLPPPILSSRSDVCILPEPEQIFIMRLQINYRIHISHTKYCQVFLYVRTVNQFAFSFNSLCCFPPKYHHVYNTTLKSFYLIDLFLFVVHTLYKLITRSYWVKSRLAVAALLSYICHAEIKFNCSIS